VLYLQNGGRIEMPQLCTFEKMLCRCSSVTCPPRPRGCNVMIEGRIQPFTGSRLSFLEEEHPEVNVLNSSFDT